MRAVLAVALSVFLTSSWGQLGPGSAIKTFPAREDEPVWKEDVVVPPAFPADGNLLEFRVEPVTANRFFVDAATLSVGSDGVVRYVLVVKAAGGATNVTFEGIRCGSGEFRLYATGRQDGSWVPARRIEWRAIENKSVNGYHAVLNRELFCPARTAIGSADEGRDALRRGRHPGAL